MMRDFSKQNYNYPGLSIDKVIVNPMLNIYSGNDMHEIYPNGDEVYGIVAIYTAYDYEGELSFNKDETINLEWFYIDNLPDNIHNVDTKPIKEAILCYKNNMNS